MNKDSSFLFRFKDVSIGYNNSIILKDINFPVKQGDYIGVIGSNGSGKTSLLKLILRLIKPMKGEIEYGFDFFKGSIAYLPQQSFLDKHFPITLKEIVSSGLTASKGLFKGLNLGDKKKIDEVMELTGIEKLKDRSISNVSGGQLQRALLSRAIVGSPKIILLDEPDAFIDRPFIEDFYNILNNINERIAIILVSHNLTLMVSSVKSIICIDETLHYHNSNEITSELLDTYNCPMEVLYHGKVPHRVLAEHK